MKYRIRQRIFSWFDSYDIYDEDGKTAFTVKGQLSWGHCLHILNRQGKHIATVKEKVITWLPKFEFYISGRYQGMLKRKYSLFRPSYVIDFNGWHVTGDSLQWDYDIVPWEKPWTTACISNPANPVSHTQYKGVNRFLLWMVSDMRGVEDSRWATFNQIADVNSKYHPNQKWHLKKGSKGIPVELWKIRKVGTKELIDFDDYAKIVKDDPEQKKNYTLYISRILAIQ